MKFGGLFLATALLAMAALPAQAEDKLGVRLVRTQLGCTTESCWNILMGVIKGRQLRIEACNKRVDKSQCREELTALDKGLAVELRRLGH